MSGVTALRFLPALAQGCGASAEPLPPPANQTARAYPGSAKAIATGGGGPTSGAREDSYRADEETAGPTAKPSQPVAAATTAPASNEPNEKTEAAIAATGQFISVGTSLVSALDDAASSILDAVSQNADGSYTLQSRLGPFSFDDPFLKSIASSVVYSASELLQATPAGKVLFMTLAELYGMFMKSHTKPQWLAEYMLFLTSIEAEVRAGQSAFQRQGFILLIVDALVDVRVTFTKIQSRGTIASFIFAGADQETLDASKVTIEKLKQQALQGMFIEVHESAVAVNDDLKALIAQVKAQRDTKWGSRPMDEATMKKADELAKAKLLPTLLTPLRFDADIATLDARFCRGTRRAMLVQFDAWVRVRPEWCLPDDATGDFGRQGYVEAEERVFLIVGVPGTGKSTLAGHIAHEYASIIYAAHFCNDLPSRSDPMQALRSILYQLLTAIPALKAWFLAKLAADGGAAEQRLRSGGSAQGSTSVQDFWEEWIQAGFQQGVTEKAKERVLATSAAAAAAAAGSTKKHGGFSREAAVRGILPDCVTRESEVIDEKSTGAGAAAAGAGAPPHIQPRSKLLILIDSLEECGFDRRHHTAAAASASASSSPAEDLLSLLSNAQLLARLPPWIGFVVTARKEERVTSGLGRVWPMRELSVDSPENQADLVHFLTHTLRPLIAPPEHLDEAVREILDKSDGNFLVAAMRSSEATSASAAAASSSSEAPRLTLQEIRGCADGMSQWFSTTLNKLKAHPTFSNEGEEGDRDDSGSSPKIDLPERPSWTHVMWLLRFILVAHEPLSVAALSELLGCDATTVEEVLVPLRSFLPLQPGATDGAPPTVRLFHRSLRAWLTSDERKLDENDHALYCDLAVPSSLLTTNCLGRLFVDPRQVAAPGSGAPGSTFPMLRYAELLRRSVRPEANVATDAATSDPNDSDLDVYAIRWTARHLLQLEPAKSLAAMRALHCSLLFLALRVERGEATDFLRDFHHARHALQTLLAPSTTTTTTASAADDLSVAWSKARRTKKGLPPVASIDVASYDELARFLQAEVRHLVHGCEPETRAAMTCHLAASYPPETMVCRQANQSDLVALWSDGSSSKTTGLFVDGRAKDSTANCSSTDCACNWPWA